MYSKRSKTCHFGAVFIRVDGRMSPEYRNEPTLGLFPYSGPVVGPNIENAPKGGGVIGMLNTQGTSIWGVQKERKSAETQRRAQMGMSACFGEGGRGLCGGVVQKCK